MRVWEVWGGWDEGSCFQGRDIMIERYSELWVYQTAFEAAQEIFGLTKAWPAEERYALTDQIRRSSRSVCANIAEAWRKRRYPRHFISKMSDADAEAAETQCWLDFAHACDYLPESQHEALVTRYHKIMAGLVRMMAAPDRWCGPSTLAREPEALYDLDSSPDLTPYTPPTSPTPHTPQTSQTPNHPHPQTPTPRSVR